MAVATYTSTTYLNSPITAPHTGNISKSGKAQWTAAGTVGDIVFLCKVPHGAEIVDFGEYHTNGETAVGLDFGFDRGIAAGGAGNASCLISGGAIATMNRLSFAAAPSHVPIRISLSDTDPVRYAVLQAKGASGTLTISTSIAWGLTYRMDQ